MTTPPLNTEAEAMALEKVRAIYDARGPRGTMTAATRAMLRWVLEDAGVELGAYDERIADWAGTWEPHVVAVVCGWIERAHEAGKAARDSEAGKLLERVRFLRQNGERAPGGDETWPPLDRDIERFLRSLLPPE